MNYIKLFIGLMSGLLLVPSLWAQQLPLAVDDVRFVNTGKIYIGQTNQTTDALLYIPTAVRMLSDTVNIVQHGKTVIAGNFYQDSEGNVFDGNSTGAVVFRNNVNQFITCNSTLMANFDRGLNYIAFPGMEIDNDAFLVVVPKMGIDANRISRTSGKTGGVYLQSAPESTATNAGIYDASLRVTGTSPLPAGIVAVERYVENYRGTTDAQCALFPFASPFDNTQRAGYFAGNWLRHTFEYDTFGGSLYPMADTPGDINRIAENHYIVSASQILDPGKAYFVKLRPLGAYNNLDYVVTGSAPTHEFPNFIFDGNAYNLPAVDEQVFTKPVLFEGAIPNLQPDNNVNWVIGNSYTSPLSLSKIIDKMNNSSLNFVPEIYVFVPGQTTFLPISTLPGNQTPSLLDITEIPSMAVFMVKLAKGQTQNGTFSIGASEQTHKDIIHNLRTSPINAPDLLLHLSLASNPHLYDKAVIGLREGAKADFDALDMMKAYNEARETFQIYTLSKDNIMLSSNAIPFEETAVDVAVATNSEPLRLILEASRLESLPHEKVWLEDKKTGAWLNLMENLAYEFESDENFVNRFRIHFDMYGTSLPSIKKDTDIRIYYADNELVVDGLQQQDVDGGIYLEIMDMRGTVLTKLSVHAAPRWKTTLSFAPGVYIARLNGKKNFIYKFKI